MTNNPRQLALTGLIRVSQGRSLSDVLPQFKSLESNDRGLATELVFGTLHHYFELQAIAKGLLSRPLKHNDKDVMLCLMMGIYQLHYTRIPDHAAIHETVALCDGLNKAWGKAILNAILRRIQRTPDLIATFEMTKPSRYNLPNWLYDQLLTDWGETAHDWLPHMHTKAPITLRVNSMKASREEYLAKLKDAEISATTLAHTTHGINLSSATDITTLPGYDEGLFSVQDGAAQNAGAILDPQAGEHILDACAAPGGKSAHILELTSNDCHLVALDNVEDRLARLRGNLSRLSLSADVRCGDAITPTDWLADNELFDRILCDAPCSATGIIRRHPDICQHRTIKDVKRLNQTQWRILKSLWSCLKPGGTMVYSTCSVLQSENAAMISDFVRHNTDASLVPFSNPLTGTSTDGTWQIFPGTEQMDGFFYAKLHKAK